MPKSYEESASRTAESFRDLRFVAGSIGGTSLVGVVITGGYAFVGGGWQFAVQVLWALGIWCAALALGFLFAIPKVLQSSQGNAKTAPAQSTESGSAAPTDGSASAELAYQQRVNTNLEEISDWLTKIIIGVTLVQLKSLPPYVTSLADQITANLVETTGRQGFGIAIIITFSTLGFLFGYLVTRLYIQGALSRAERALADPDEYERMRRLVQSNSALLEQATRTAAAPASAPPTPAVEQDLKRLGDDYLNINIADWSARIKAKDAAAAELFMAAAQKGVSKDWLAAQTEEPYLLALAAWVQAAPEPGDAARLLKAGPNVKHLHGKYWITQALGKLADSNQLTPDERAQARSLLESYKKGADAPLLRLSDAVMKRF